jgi:hypothetical protein
MCSPISPIYQPNDNNNIRCVANLVLDWRASKAMKKILDSYPDIWRNLTSFWAMD